MKFKKYFSFLLISISMFMYFVPINVFAQDTVTSPYYYVYDKESIFTRTEIDKFTTIGEMLSVGNVDLIFNIAKENANSDNSECKKIYYTYLKDIDYSKTNKEKKVIVMSYYLDETKLYVYDDYGIITDEFMTKLNEKMKKFKTVNQTNAGLLSIYEYMAKYLNTNQHLGINSISDITIYDPFGDKSVISLKNGILVGIVVIIVLGFRRNKKSII